MPFQVTYGDYTEELQLNKPAWLIWSDENISLHPSDNTYATYIHYSFKNGSEQRTYEQMYSDLRNTDEGIIYIIFKYTDVPATQYFLVKTKKDLIFCKYFITIMCGGNENYIRNQIKILKDLPTSQYANYAKNNYDILWKKYSFDKAIEKYGYYARVQNFFLHHIINKQNKNNKMKREAKDIVLNEPFLIREIFSYLIKSPFARIAYGRKVISR